jgi:hypothetical protein
MHRHLERPQVEALFFEYIHFWGNRNTYVSCPSWYRTAPRIVRNNLTIWAPKGLFFIVMDSKRRGRYPRAAPAGARIFHYGNMRPKEQYDLKTLSVYRYWGNTPKLIDYGDIDPQILRRFTGTHPAAARDWLPAGEGLFQPPADRRLTVEDRRHRLMAKLERWLHVDLTHKHYRRVA